jgi:exosortase/archaeosortase family protein
VSGPPPRHPKPPGRPRRAPSRAALAFVGRFALGWVAVLLVATLVPAIERRAIAGTVASVAGVLRAAAFRPIVSDASILVGARPVEITPDCTPLMPTAALWIAMLAFPASLPWRLAGALAGAAVLWLYNIARIMAMIGVLNVRPDWFEFLHLYMWQTLTLVVVIGLFLLWLRLEPRPRAGG